MNAGDRGGASGVQVRLGAIEREWTRLGTGDIWLHLRAPDGRLEAFADAVAEVNLALGDPFGEGVSHAPNGYAVLLTHCADLGDARRWLADFADALARRGVAGTVQLAPRTKQRSWFTSSRPPVPTAYVEYTVDLQAITADAVRDSHWHVTADTTARITAFVDRWARIDGAEMQLAQDIYRVAVHLDDSSEQLSRSLLDLGAAGLRFVDDARQRATHVSLTPNGLALFQYIDNDEDWTARVARMRSALTGLPADTDQAYLRPAVVGSLGMDTMHAALPLPGIREAHVRYNRHLLDRYLPDAHGIQVVRQAHLDRARDLSAWEITDLGDDRYLVQANDLAPWYATELPDQDTLVRARADFAGALLTEQIIRDNPPPWDPDRIWP